MPNFVSDLSLSLLLITGFALFARFYSRRHGLSILPSIAIGPLLIIVGLLLYLPGSPLFIPSDGIYYQSWGFQISEAWTSGLKSEAPIIWPGKVFWPLIIAIFHYLFGPISVALIVFNAVCVLLATLILQKATKLLTGRSPRWSITFLLVTWSPLFLFGPSMLREAIFWLGTSLGVLSIAYLAQRFTLSGVLSLAGSGALLLAIRPDAGVVFLYGFTSIGLVIIGLHNGARNRKRLVVTGLALLLLLASAPHVMTWISPIIEREGDHVGGWRENLAEPGVTTAVTTLPVCDLVGLSDFSGSGFLTSLACGAASSLPAALFGPFWWEINIQ